MASTLKVEVPKILDLDLFKIKRKKWKAKDDFDYLKRVKASAK